MNILLVDDQTSILDGLLSGLHFQEIGFDVVKSASSAQEALDIFQTTPIDVLLTDIEMPGKSGLSLSQTVREQYPDTLCILLTSHADFSYAQEGVKLGCFDYLVQPVPYEEIEASLRRAAQQLYQNRQKKQLQLYGQLYRTNQAELMNHTVLNLYSKAPQDVEASIQLLNQLGYPLSLECPGQILIIDAFPFHRENPDYSEKSVLAAMETAFRMAPIQYPVFPLTTVNPYKQFVTLLFAGVEANVSSLCTPTQLQDFFTALSQELGGQVDCYVGKRIVCSELRQEVKRIHTFINDNIDNAPGLYFTNQETQPLDTPSTLPECITRWKTLLDSGRKNMLDAEINTYLEKLTLSSKNRFRDMCAFHQQLTQLFFSYFYENHIDMYSLFTEDFTYSDYMDSFKSIDTLKKGIRFLLDAIDAQQREDSPQSDVEKAKSYIVANLSKTILVKDVAQHVNLNAEYFTKLFKKETGQSLKDFITRSKIAAAKDLLEHSNISVSTVALELGYDNFSHFTQIFKKYENMTPSEYRKQFLSQG